MYQIANPIFKVLSKILVPNKRSIMEAQFLSIYKMGDDAFDSLFVITYF